MRTLNIYIYIYIYIIEVLFERKIELLIMVDDVIIEALCKVSCHCVIAGSSHVMYDAAAVRPLLHHNHRLHCCKP